MHHCVLPLLDTTLNRCIVIHHMTVLDNTFTARNYTVQHQTFTELYITAPHCTSAPLNITGLYHCFTKCRLTMRCCTRRCIYQMLPNFSSQHLDATLRGYAIPLLHLLHLTGQDPTFTLPHTTIPVRYLYSTRLNTTFTLRDKTMQDRTFTAQNPTIPHLCQA